MINSDLDVITVSVYMTAYNHALYIRKAIEGVLMQKTNFRLELVIGEDCSTDNTREICLEYKNKYPDVIKLFLPEKNIGAYQNSIETLNKCTGKYIAMCEGDDYWIDPHKLQKQVDFMEANTDYSMVYHRVNVFDEVSKKMIAEGYNLSEEEKTYTIEDLAVRNFIHTPSVLFRTDVLDFTILKENIAILMDYFLWMICAQKGKIKYLPDVMAVYRIWDGSAWELKNVKTKTTTWLIMLTHLLPMFSDKKKVYESLFVQMKSSYKSLYSAGIDNDSKTNLDEITKKLLVENNDFQIWWFTYMIHVKESRLHKLKYYFFLLTKGSLSSVYLLKKCLY